MCIRDRKYVKYVADKKAKSLIICGPPGMSKTYIVRRVFHFKGLTPGKDYWIAKGSSLGIIEAYTLFYKNRDRIIVLDDFDTPLRNEDMINMLKAITDSYSKRVLALPREILISSGEGGTEEQGVPEQFEFRGHLIIITNIEKKHIDRALLSRSPTIEVNFNTKEILEALQSLMKFINPDIHMEMKKEVYNYILELKKNSKIHLDFRGFKSAIEVRYCVPEHWKEMTKIIVNF